MNGPELECILRLDLRQTSSARWPRSLTLVLAVAAGGAVLWALLREGRDRRQPAAGASWIWFSYGAEDPEPIRFFAGCEFSWRGGAGDPAKALVFVDRRYVLSVNGSRVGAGGQKPGESLDAYDVSRFLRPGVNRVVVEAESENGVGGILFSLTLPSGERVVSDRTWRVSLLEANLFSKGAPAIVWGRPPMYPWGYPAPPASTAAATKASRPIRAAAQ
jgi:hypothetical protein